MLDFGLPVAAAISSSDSPCSLRSASNCRWLSVKSRCTMPRMVLMSNSSTPVVAETPPAIDRSSIEPDVLSPIPLDATGFRNLDGQSLLVPDRIPFFRQLPERQQRILHDVFRIRVTSGSPVETPRQGCQSAPDPVR